MIIIGGGGQGKVLSVIVLVAGLVGMALVILFLIRKSGRKAVEASPPPVVPSRLSLLCAFSLLSALGALLVALTGFILADVAWRSDIVGLDLSDRDAILLGSEIFRYAALLPALCALAFGLAGGGAIRESQGALRGRALSRMAMILALAVGVATFTNMPRAARPVVHYMRTTR